MKKIFLKNYKFRRITKPNTIRYKINNFNPFEEKYFINKSIANNEDRNVVISPRISWKKPTELKSLKEKMNSIIAAKVMAGIPKRKENLAASSLFQPDTKAVEIVIPDLETPGKMAKDWERPIRKLSE